MRRRSIPTKTELERRRKISESMKALLSNNPEAIEKRKLIWTGRKHSEESKLKMSESRRKRTTHFSHTEETKEKIRLAMLGRRITWSDKISKARKGNVVISEEQKNHISETLKAHYAINPNPFKGKVHTESSKQKMREANLGKFRGENGPNWKGGINSLPYDTEWTRWLREIIRERDDNTCQNPRCKTPHELLDTHHIDYNKENSDQTNLITICKRCHGKTQRNREYWKRYYQTIMIRKNSPIN